MRVAARYFVQWSSRTTTRAKKKWVARAAFFVIRGSSVGHRQMSAVGLEFLQHRAAAFANCGIRFVLADVYGVIPAAVALRAISFLDLDVHSAAAVAGALHQRYRRDDEQITQLVFEAGENRVSGIGRSDYELRLKTLSDPLAVAFFLQSFHGLFPHREQSGPILLLLCVLFGNRLVSEDIGRVRELREVHALQPVRHFRQVLPDFFAGETQDWRQQA